MQPVFKPLTHGNTLIVLRVGISTNGAEMIIRYGDKDATTGCISQPSTFGSICGVCFIRSVAVVHADVGFVGGRFAGFKSSDGEGKAGVDAGVFSKLAVKVEPAYGASLLFGPGDEVLEAFEAEVVLARGLQEQRVRSPLRVVE